MKRNSKILNVKSQPFDLGQKWQSIARPVSMGVSFVLLIAALAMPESRLWLSLIAFAAAAWEILWAACMEIVNKKPERCIPLALSGILILSIGHLLESVLAMLLLYGGLWLQKLGQRNALKSRSYYEGLLSMRARLREQDRYHVAVADKLAPGTLVEVFSGETFPADGIVTAGEGTVDYSTLMRGQKSFAFCEGSKVYCGGINHGQNVTLKVSAAGRYTLAQMMSASLDVALKNQATVQKVLAKILPLVSLVLLVLAVITGLIVPLLGGQPWKEALYMASGILMMAGVGEILAGISLAFSVGIVTMSRRGVLFKSCRQVMLLRRITDMIFSKTGTLTDRAFRVEEIVPHNEYTKDQLLYYAATAEQISDHLIAKAILREAKGKELPEVEHRLEIPGEGVCVVAEGKRIFVGNDLLMRRTGIPVLPYHGQGMICFVGVEDTYIGCIILHDPLKVNAIDTVNGLFSMGMHSIDLVTGDKKNNAENVGATLGIHRVFAELDAKGKAEIVSRNARKGKHGGRICFVGDEEDTACLEAADISFAMMTLEEDIRGTGADIAVLSDDPEGVLQSFALSHKLSRVILTLLIATLTIKVLLLILLLIGFMPLWIVALAESGLRLFGVYLAQSCRK